MYTSHFTYPFFLLFRLSEFSLLLLLFLDCDGLCLPKCQFLACARCWCGLFFLCTAMMIPIRLYLGPFIWNTHTKECAMKFVQKLSFLSQFICVRSAFLQLALSLFWFSFSLLQKRFHRSNLWLSTKLVHDSKRIVKSEKLFSIAFEIFSMGWHVRCIKMRSLSCDVDLWIWFACTLVMHIHS